MILSTWQNTIDILASQFQFIKGGFKKNEADAVAIDGEDNEELSGSSVDSVTSRPSTSSSYPTGELHVQLQIQRLPDDEANADAVDSDEEFLDTDVGDVQESSCSEDSDHESEEDSAEEPGEEDSAEESGDEKWTFHRGALPRPPDFTSHEEVRVDEINTSAFDFFKLMFTDDLLKTIVDSTNQCAQQILNEITAPQARIRKWKQLTNENLLIFLGILFHMGHIKVNSYSQYWRKHYLFNLFPSQFMAKNTFLLIFKCLRFGQHNLDTLIAYFNKRMTELYNPGEELSIDEPIIFSHGRSEFRQYIKGRRHKYGIKLYMLATASGLPLKIHLHRGKQDQEVGGKRHTEKVVANLLKEHLGTGRHVYMDSYYSSVRLSESLLRNGVNVTGTLRSNCQGNPAVVTTKLKKGGSIFRYNRQGVCVCKWRDKREVLTISTKHSPELKPVINRRGKHLLKPEMVIKYNQFMNGVNRQGQMLAHYTCEHKTMRWYKKVGIHIFQMMMLNAYCLYQNKFQKKIGFYAFRESVITKLLPPRPVKNGSKQTKGITHLPVHLPRDQNRITKRRRCKHCWDTIKKRVNTLCYCPSCPNQPGLCLECFRAYHKY